MDSKLRYIKSDTNKMLGCECLPSEKKDNDYSYPIIYMKDKDIPEAKDWEVGKEYLVEMKVKMLSRTENVKNNGSVELSIRAIATDED